MIRIQEKNGKKTVLITGKRGREVFIVNAGISDALIRNLFNRCDAGLSAGETDAETREEARGDVKLSAAIKAADNIKVPRKRVKKPEHDYRR